jgi:prepilin-type N-terminal cleavage/methylation domain-containing protein
VRDLMSPHPDSLLAASLHGRATRLKSRPGFTLIEVMVAMMVLVVGVLALAATAGVVTKQMASGSRQSTAAVIAQARFDSLTSLACKTLSPPGGAVASGTVQHLNGMVKEKWSVADGTNVKALTDTIWVYGRKDAGQTYLLYYSLIPCRD